MAKVTDDLDEAIDLFYLSTCNYFLHVLHEEKCKSSKKRRIWMNEMYSQRTRKSLEKILFDMKAEPSGHFQNFCRMSSTDFEILLTKIDPLVSKKDTGWRNAVPSKIRLAITLRFLASGDSYTSLQNLFKISNQLISTIVPEVCDALITVLKDEVKLPKTENEWLEKAAGFQNAFPHCVGALDGKHVVLESKPMHSASEYYNYKNTFSIVLLALVDSNYLFMFADIGCKGRMSDGGVLRNSALWKKINENNLNLPQPCPLPGRTHKLPYVFVADSAFALCQNIMKPFPGTHTEGSIKRSFNRHLSRTRVVVENVFGIMTSVFRVFKKPMLLQPDKASLVTMTCVLLHNFLRSSRTSGALYAPPESFDRIENNEYHPGIWRNNETSSGLCPLLAVPRRATDTAQIIRNEFAEYFMTAL